jgi:hypothetical protein
MVWVILLCGAVCSAGALTPFSDDQDRWGFRDSSGRTVIAPQYVQAGAFSPEGLAPVVDQEGWLYIDLKGRPLVRPFVFDNGPDYFEEGLSRFVADGKIGFIDRAGVVVIPAVHDFALPFCEKMAVVCTGCRPEDDGDEHTIMVGGKWGYINRTGSIVIPLEYDRADSFADGEAQVSKDGRNFAIDRTGRKINRK